MKSISVVVLLLIVLSAASFAIMPIIIRDRDNGKTSHISVGDFVDVALNGNPTTGYDWFVDSKITPVLMKISGPDFKRASERIGAGGKVTYRFKAVKKGVALLKLVYKRSWEKAPPSKSFVVKIMAE